MRYFLVLEDLEGFLGPIWITSGDCYIFSMLEIFSKSQLIYCTTGQDHNGKGIVFGIYPLIL